MTTRNFEGAMFDLDPLQDDFTISCLCTARKHKYDIWYTHWTRAHTIFIVSASESVFSRQRRIRRMVGSPENESLLPSMTFIAAFDRSILEQIPNWHHFQSRALALVTMHPVAYEGLVCRHWGQLAVARRFLYSKTSRHSDTMVTHLQLHSAVEMPHLLLAWCSPRQRVWWADWESLHGTKYIVASLWPRVSMYRASLFTLESKIHYYEPRPARITVQKTLASHESIVYATP